MVIRKRRIQRYDRQLRPGTFAPGVARSRRVGRVPRDRESNEPRGRCERRCPWRSLVPARKHQRFGRHGVAERPGKRSAKPHRLRIVGELLAAIKADDVWFALGDAMLPNWRHRPTQAAVVAMEEPLEDGLDHEKSSPGQGPGSYCYRQTAVITLDRTGRREGRLLIFASSSPMLKDVSSTCRVSFTDGDRRSTKRPRWGLPNSKGAVSHLRTWD